MNYLRVYFDVAKALLMDDAEAEYETECMLMYANVGCEWGFAVNSGCNCERWLDAY